eukprot:TRINITY_DN126_c0_g2_i2.p1 TRINITY_DN126_c0_g2~~TRINITY_DN126_c0_g2_i2.p1  ORF type:complete len:186 (+),score=24.72 TRINITY_DN126_c0_g2_i2:95-652(+)
MAEDLIDEDDAVFKQFQHEVTPGGFLQPSNLANGVFAALVPITLYTGIFNMSIFDYFLLYFIVTVAVGVSLSFSYHNVSNFLRSLLDWKRDGLVTNARVRKSNQDQNTENIKSLVEAQKKEQRQITYKETLFFSILYNNLFFLLLVVFLGFYILRSVPGVYNYILSLGGAAAAVTYLSQTNSQNQ